MSSTTDTTAPTEAPVAEATTEATEATETTEVPPPTPEAIEAAEKAKAEGNEMFRIQNYAAASKHYQTAIQLNPLLVAAYTNLAFCHLKLEEYGAVVEVCTRALAVDPTNPKALYRRGAASRLLGKLDDALRDLRAALRMKPGDADITLKVNEVLKERKRQSIINALRCDDPIPTWKKLAERVAQWPRPPADFEGPTFDISSAPTAEFAVAMMEHFFKEKSLHRVQAFGILLLARELLATLPNIVPVSVPSDGTIHVCGDTHGQFYDLYHIFKTKGYPSETNRFLFNGDFVDRGSFSVEVALTMLTWKIIHPTSFFISRGNHEARDQNKIFGFEGEVKAKYNEDLFELFMDVFQAMPLGHLINEKVFVVHGGLCSRDGVTIADLQAVNRFVDSIEPGLMADLLWSDPAENPMQVGRTPSKRGIGIEFGPAVTREFLANNNLKMVVRSHQVRDEGYTVEHDGQLVTVFSAPNYCDTLGNKAAVLTFKGEDMSYTVWQFSSQPHPDVKPMQYSRMNMWAA